MSYNLYPYKKIKRFLSVALTKIKMNLTQLKGEITINVKHLNALDTAVLLEKATLLNGMLVHGTPEQKKEAHKEWEKLEKEIRLIIPVEAFEMAKRELALDHDNITLSMFEEQ